MPMENRKPTEYVIRAARDEESNSGWVWIGGPSKTNPRSRTVVKITRDGCGRGLYVEARVIDENFVDKYNSSCGRCRIDLNKNTIVMGDWYRRALDIVDNTPCDEVVNTPRDEKSGTIELHVKAVDFQGWAALFAACHSPDATVRLATQLGMLGVWLGLLALADPALKVCEHIVRQDSHFQLLKNQLPISWTTDYLHALAMIIIALLLAFPGIVLCRGRPQPRSREVIAVLGWGSLLWDGGSEFDAWHGPWLYDGPRLSIEFSRVSKSRHGALTLVIDPTNGVPTTVAHCLSRCSSIAEAIEVLRKREETSALDIGFVRRNGEARFRDREVRDEILSWTADRDMDGVVWRDSARATSRSPFPSPRRSRMCNRSNLREREGDWSMSAVRRPSCKRRSATLSPTYASGRLVHTHPLIRLMPTRFGAGHPKYGRSAALTIALPHSITPAFLSNYEKRGCRDLPWPRPTFA